MISNQLENEQRFRTPELLARYGVRRAINVILQGDGAPYGVLEVDSTSEGAFSEKDIAFLQGAANIVGMAIERQRHERRRFERVPATDRTQPAPARFPTPTVPSQPAHVVRRPSCDASRLHFRNPMHDVQSSAYLSSHERGTT